MPKGARRSKYKVGINKVKPQGLKKVKNRQDNVHKA